MEPASLYSKLFIAVIEDQINSGSLVDEVYSYAKKKGLVLPKKDDPSMTKEIFLRGYLDGKFDFMLKKDLENMYWDSERYVADSIFVFIAYYWSYDEMVNVGIDHSNLPKTDFLLKILYFKNKKHIIIIDIGHGNQIVSKTDKVVVGFGNMGTDGQVTELDRLIMESYQKKIMKKSDQKIIQDTKKTKVRSFALNCGRLFKLIKTGFEKAEIDIGESRNNVINLGDKSLKFALLMRSKVFKQEKKDIEWVGVILHRTLDNLKYDTYINRKEVNKAPKPFTDPLYTPNGIEEFSAIDAKNMSVWYDEKQVLGNIMHSKERTTNLSNKHHHFVNNLCQIKCKYEKYGDVKKSKYNENDDQMVFEDIDIDSRDGDNNDGDKKGGNRV